MMKWLKVPKNRLILISVPVVLLWTYYVYVVHGPKGQSVFAGSLTLSIAILLEAAILWPFAQRWSRRRIVVTLAFIGLIIWVLWTVDYLSNPRWQDSSLIVIDEKAGTIEFQPTLSNLLSDLVAWPHVALGLIYRLTVAGVAKSVLAILVLITPFVVLPAAALSVAAYSILPYLDGSRQLSSRQRILLVILGMFLSPVLLWTDRLLELFSYYLPFDIFTIIPVSSLGSIGFLGYLFRPLSSKWREKWAIVITSFTLLLLSFALLTPIPMPPSSIIALQGVEFLPLWLLPAVPLLDVPFPFLYLGPLVLLLLVALLGGIALSTALNAIEAFSPWSSKITRRVILGSLAFLAMTFGYSTSWHTIAQGGVSQYDGGVWKTFTTEIEEGFAENEMLAMFEDSHGNIWVGTESGLNRYDGLKWETFTTKDGLIADRINVILEDRQGNIWIGTRAGVSCYDGQKWQAFTAQDEARLEYVQAMLEDHQGNIWVVTDYGPSRYDGQQWEHFSVENPCLGLIYEDSHGNIWFGNQKWYYCDRGLTRYDGTDFQTITTQDGLAANDVYSILEDRYGVLWFASYTPGFARQDGQGEDKDIGGVTRYDRVSWETISQESGPSEAEVIFEDHKGNLWFGSGSWEGDGLSRYDGKAWQQSTVEDGLASNVILAILEDQQGNLWIGTQGGLNRYNPVTDEWETFTSLNSGLVVDSVEHLLFDQKGNLWVGAYTFEQVPRAPWLAITVAALVFLGTPVLLYRRFVQLPSTRAERLGRRLERAPEELYPTYYRLLASEPDAAVILRHQGNLAAFKWAAVPAALGGLAEEMADPVAALRRLVTALSEGPEQPDRAKLEALYQFLLDAAQARTSAAIANLEITVRHDPKIDTIIHTHAGPISPVPDFLSPKLSEALAQVEALVGALRNYVVVDGMSKKVSSLAHSLSLIEALQKTASETPPPDGPILIAMATRWRMLITETLGELGGARMVEPLARDFFAQANFRMEELGAGEFLVIPQGQAHPQALYGPMYTRLIAGRPPTGDDFTAVCEAARQRYGTDGEDIDLAHRVAIVISDRRPEPGARYRLYEIRQQEGLAIVPLDSFLFGQIKPNRTASDILTSEIDQATGRQNLYAISGPVSGDLSFFGRERVLQEIIDLLVASQPTAIFGLRKVGKTSLIQRLQGRLAQQRAIALVDTQGTVRQQGVWPLYPVIVSAFVSHLQRYRPDLTLPTLRLYPVAGPLSAAVADAFLQDLSALYAALGQPDEKERLLLIVDEVDRLLPSGATPGYDGFAAFFGQLRAANQQAGFLDFAVVGVDPTVNRCERWQDHDNELYRALREMWMPPMAPEDVQEMIESLGSQMGVRYEDEALQLLARVGGGQPFVTRQMCSLAVEGQLGTGAITVTADLALAAVEEFVFRDPYLPELWRTRLDDSQREMLRVLAQALEPLPRTRLLPARRRQEALDSLRALEEYTLVRRDEGGYVIAWDVFRYWIRWVELGLEE